MDGAKPLQRVRLPAAAADGAGHRLDRAPRHHPLLERGFLVHQPHRRPFRHAGAASPPSRTPRASSGPSCRRPRSWPIAPIMVFGWITPAAARARPHLRRGQVDRSGHGDRRTQRSREALRKPRSDQGRRPQDRGPRVRRLRRSVRLREVDAAARDRRAGRDRAAASSCIDGQRVNDVAPDKRGLAMVFQSYALYPHMSVGGNMAFALRLARVPRAEREEQVRTAARTLQLEELLDRKPQRAFRRPAAAGGDRPRHRAQPEGLSVRRAALQP